MVRPFDLRLQFRFEAKDKRLLLPCFAAEVSDAKPHAKKPTRIPTNFTTLPSVQNLKNRFAQQHAIGNRGIALTF